MLSTHPMIFRELEDGLKQQLLGVKSLDVVEGFYFTPQELFIGAHDLCMIDKKLIYESGLEREVVAEFVTTFCAKDVSQGAALEANNKAVRKWLLEKNEG